MEKRNGQYFQRARVQTGQAGVGLDERLHRETNEKAQKIASENFGEGEFRPVELSF